MMMNSNVGKAMAIGIMGGHPIIGWLYFLVTCIKWNSFFKKS